MNHPLKWLVPLCYSPAMNRPVKFPDQSGHCPHDTGIPRVIDCEHPPMTRNTSLVTHSDPRRMPDGEYG